MFVKQGFLVRWKSTTAETLYNDPLGTEESGHCREAALVERLKQEWMYGLSTKKMAVIERWPLWRGGLVSCGGSTEYTILLLLNKINNKLSSNIFNKSFAIFRNARDEYILKAFSLKWRMLIAWIFSLKNWDLF